MILPESIVPGRNFEIKLLPGRAGLKGELFGPVGNGPGSISNCSGAGGFGPVYWILNLKKADGTAKYANHAKAERI